MTRQQHTPTDQQATLGMLLGLAGVLAFSLSLPMNRLAVAHLDAGWVALARAVIASVLGAAILLGTGAPRPPRALLKPLAFAALGVVAGFPLLTSLAMKLSTASHGAIVIALLPIATTIAATRISREKPSVAFWLSAIIGAAIVLAFVLWHGAMRVGPGDLLLMLAVAAGAFGYAWGGQVSASLGGWQTICWIVVLCAPVTVPLLIISSVIHSDSFSGTPMSAWLAVAYLGMFSQLFGFFFWYGGMAIGGVSRVSQVQLLQLFFTLIFSALALGEIVGWHVWVVALLIVAVIGAARLAPVKRAG